jgi:glucose-fructose oxidoreductase
MDGFNRRRFISTSSGIIASVALWPSIIIPQEKKNLGVALVGLGYYSTDLLAPALQLTRNCHLAGIVTGSPEKIKPWQEKYNIPDGSVYNYENMHTIENNPAIDIAYSVLPTGMHAEYSVIAANAGKHVWCEKPMARTEKECQSIIDACNKNKVKLSIGYRMQHEPNTRTIIDYALTKPYGNMQSLTAEAGYVDNRKDHWKMKKAMGGGAMYDMGVYPLNAARYSTQREPLAVTARHETTRPEIFSEVDETTYFDLEFPDDIVANGVTSLGKNMNLLHVDCAQGWYELKPFQSYSGIRGKTSDGKMLDKSIPNQQAKQMDDDAAAILNNIPVIVPGEEGLQDIRIVEAIYKSAASGQRVVI